MLPLNPSSLQEDIMPAPRSTDDSIEQTASSAPPSIMITDIQPVQNEIKKKKLHKIASNVPRNERSIFYRGSSKLVGGIENLCVRWGTIVATYPWMVIIIPVLLAVLSGAGFYNMTFEFRPYKLWVKEPSLFREVHEWKMKNFPNNIRKHIAIWEMDNILTAAAIKQIWTVHKEVDKFRTTRDVSYSDVCLKVPSLISNEEPMKDTSYDYMYGDEPINVWELNNDNDNKGKNSQYLDSEISSTNSDPDYYYDYDPSNVAPIMPLPNLPNWLSVISNDTGKTTEELPVNHYLTSEAASKNEREEHCEFVEELDMICYEESLLEVWGYNDALIQNLTDEKVIQDINQATSSKVTGFPRNITTYLGGIKQDIDGRIIGARGALHVWYTRVNMKVIRECEKTGCKIEIDLGSGEEVDEDSFEWENHLTNVVGGLKTMGMPINLQASYLFGSIHRSALFEDIIWIVCGWCVALLYLLSTLGNVCTPKGRISLILTGSILCIGLSVFASCGICLIFSIPYGPLNSVLPVLLIALGIDDMYVILNAWDSTEYSVNPMDTVARMRETLRHAGLAITVTSLTTVIAFIIGSITDVPALQYFCIYAAVGIACVYFLQVTLFVAAVVLNHRSELKSLSKNSKCCLPFHWCSRDKNSPDDNLMSKALGKWIKFLLKPAVTTIILIVTGLILGLSSCQAWKLDQSFESVWLLPKSSDLYRWFTTMDEIFPKDGRDGFIFFENVKFPEELPELQKLTLRLENIDVISRVDAWYDQLMKFIENDGAFKDKPLTNELFHNALSYFLFNEEGAKYRNDIIFSNGTELVCNEPAPAFITFKINFQYIRLKQADANARQYAMSTVREIVANANISGYKAPWALSYGQWETENVIRKELLRNMSLVLIIVFVMTMLLLASIRAALLILFCVLATLINVSALMHLWGLTINTVTCITLVLGIGICVDYASHITHGFLVSQGSRKHRVVCSMRRMGPAVFHGGMSTLLAFVTLSPSDTYVFLSYFKIFTCIAGIGLLQALILLPILLSLLGPPPYPDKKFNTSSSITTEDSHSCTTESSSYPDTPSVITPAITPLSTTPNSPSSSRSSPPLHHSFESNKKDNLCLPSKKSNTRHRPIEEEPQINRVPVFGSQALKNIKLTESLDLKIKKVQDTDTDSNSSSSSSEENNSMTTVTPTIIDTENIHKLYVKNS